MPATRIIVDPRRLPDSFFAARRSGEAGLWCLYVVGENPGRPDPTAEAAALAAEQRHRAKSAESFERCDTDGFLSQWADDLSAGEARLAAELARAGGYALFPGLFDETTGARVPAVLVTGLYGAQWRLCEPATGVWLQEWVNDTRGPRGALARRGWVVLGEWAPAKATIRGEGRGLSGSARAAIVRTDGGYPGRP